ncbi:MAG TPA: lipocalin family protein [Candidatus Aquabacterium excrementipullorum]|nr:lipocalin family protein [Candidatus Aquabacterium excrementipullorum]
MSRRITASLASLCALLGLGGCGGARDDLPPLPRVAQVDLPRYMGDWYVIASIPSFLEKDTYDAVESYAVRPDGRIQTTFRYRQGGHDEPVKTMHPIGTVKPGTGNALWDMQFFWPIQAEYVISHVSEDYSQTIVARSARDLVWIMARTPSIPPADYQAHLARIRAMGYDTTRLRLVPHTPAGAVLGKD